MDLVTVTALFADLPQPELVSWVERGWIIPDAGEGGFEFHEIDVARVRLVYDLRHQMDIAEDAVPLVLSLLDQVYQLRGTLKTVLEALATQPEDVRSAVLGAIGRPPP